MSQGRALKVLCLESLYSALLACHTVWCAAMPVFRHQSISSQLLKVHHREGGKGVTLLVSTTYNKREYINSSIGC